MASSLKYTLLALQAVLTADVASGAMTWASSLTKLLIAAKRDELEKCSVITRHILLCFLYQFSFLDHLIDFKIETVLVAEVWQRVLKVPTVLPAIVHALQQCSPNVKDVELDRCGHYHGIPLSDTDCDLWSLRAYQTSIL